MVLTGTEYNPAVALRSLEALIRELPDLAEVRDEEASVSGTAGPEAGARRKARGPRRAKQIKGEQARELVAAYEAGATVYELAERFGIVRQTVSRILKKHGVKTRWNRLTDEQVEEVARLYADGWSLAKLGRRFGVDVGTVRGRLVEHEVRLRDSHGRE